MLNTEKKERILKVVTKEKGQVAYKEKHIRIEQISQHIL
jgi:hypothetical protein